MRKCDCLQPGCPYCDPLNSIKDINQQLIIMLNINSMLDRRKDFLEGDINILIKYDKEIITNLQKSFKELTFEYIVETLTELGQAPSVLYDDNGNFAVNGTGFQNVAYGNETEDMEMTFFVEKKYWKPTMREALHYYLFDEDDE